MQTFKTTSCTAVVRDARMHKHTTHYGVTISMDIVLEWTAHSINCMDKFLKSAEHVHVHVYDCKLCVVNVYVRECMHACRCVRKSASLALPNLVTVLEWPIMSLAVTKSAIVNATLKGIPVCEALSDGQLVC